MAGAQGVSAIDCKTFVAMMKAPTWKIHRFEIKEGAQVRLLSEDVAIVAYEVREELTVDGKPVAFDAGPVRARPAGAIGLSSHNPSSACSSWVETRATRYS